MRTKIETFHRCFVGRSMRVMSDGYPQDRLPFRPRLVYASKELLEQVSDALDKTRELRRISMSIWIDLTKRFGEK